MEFVWMILVGLVVGALAKFLMPGDDPGGIIVTIRLGIAGSVVAGWLGRAAGLYAAGGVPGIIASVLGAMLLLFLYRLVTRRRGGTTAV